MEQTTLKWSSNLAYAIGLIATDGSLSKDKRHIILTSTDRMLLETFLKCLNKSCKISNNPKSAISKKAAYKVQITDALFYKQLEKIGLTSNKSLTINVLTIPDKYFPDFLRGHLDGDGSIITYEDRYNIQRNKNYIYNRLFVYFISASKNHVMWLQNKIKTIKGISGSISCAISKGQKGINPIWRLKFSTKQAKIILNWIYYQPNLPCLERKHKIALEFLI